MVLILVTALTAVYTYTFIRSLFWLEGESRADVKRLARLRGRDLADEHIVLTLDEMRENRRKVGLWMLACWAALILLLASRG